MCTKTKNGFLTNIKVILILLLFLFPISLWSQWNNSGIEEIPPHLAINDTLLINDNTNLNFDNMGLSKTYETCYYKKTKRYRKKKYRKKRKINHRRYGKQKKFRYYKIKRGDTLFGISKKFRTSINTIVSINKLNKRNRIFKGMVLKIPLKIKNRKRNRNKRYAKRKRKKIYIKNRPRFTWPVKYIGNYLNDGLKGVKAIGIIIVSRQNSRVLSSASGTVVKIGRMRGFGKYIVVKHRYRFITVYSNMGMITVSEGERIQKGKMIGRIDRLSNKLHFQIDYAGKPLNPLRYLPRKS
ncbi:peptidoglycan DD-metalloendopeptidase family protein [Spirochaetota bacterium]